MKQFISILLSVFLPAVCLAQTEEKIDSLISKDTLSVPLAAPIPSNGFYPSFTMRGITPFNYGFSTWELHQGFNASIGMNVTFSPDKYAPSGVGFGQNAAFLYAVPLNNRFSVAAGLYASNMNWDFINYRNVGIAGIIGFKVNDKISLYGYGSKSLTPKRSPLYYPLPNFDPDRLGAMVNFKIGESASVSFSVEGRKYPNGAIW